MTRRACIIGYHGMENFGDDLFLAITTGLLRDRLGVQQAFLHATRSPASLVPVDLHLRPLHPARRRIRRLDWVAQARAAVRSSVVVFSAGSIFAGPQFRQPVLLLRSLRAADRLRRRHTPVLGLGLSIGPFKSEADRALTASALNRFDGLLLRDRSSAEEAGRMGLANATFSHDLVTLMAPELVQRRERVQAAEAAGGMRALRLGLSLGPGYHGWDATRWADFGTELKTRLAEIAARSPQRALEVRVLNTCGSASDGDRRVADAVQAIAAEIATVRRIDYRVADREAFLDAVLGCDGLVSSRLHPALIAMGTGIPVLQLGATSPKVTGVYERIGLHPVALTSELQATPEAWSRFTAAVGDAPAFAAAAGAANRAAFLAAARVCRADVERLFEKVPRA